MKKKWILLVSLSLVVTTGLFTACKKSGNDNSNNNTNTGDLDRKAMLTAYADNYLVPGYADMTAQLNDLGTKTTAFTSAPSDATLIDLRSSFRNAYITWQRVDLLEFGPAEDVSLRMYINTYPVTTTKVEGNITSGSYDLETFGNKDAQGFPAIDYLLNGLGNDNISILAKYTSDAQAQARKQYLKDVVAKMLEKVQSVDNKWITYRNDFTGSTGTDANSSTSKMVNSFVLYFERYLRAGKIGLPAGQMTGVAKPDICESVYSPDLQKELAVTAMTSVKDFYEGKGYSGAPQDKSMKSYLTAIGTKDDNGKLIADLISTEMQEALTALQDLNGSIAGNIQNNRPTVLQVYDKLQQVIPLIKVDMVSAFGISITYVDNDGD